MLNIIIIIIKYVNLIVYTILVCMVCFASWFIESNLVTYSICTDGQMRLVGGSSQHQEIVERHSLFL